MSSGNTRGQSGFSLVEVLVASLLLVIAVVGMLAVFPQASRDTSNAGRLSVLSHIAADKLEELRSLPYSDTLLSAGAHPAQQTDAQGDRYYPVPGFGEEYSLRWTVSGGPTDAAGTAEADMKTVVVEATYLTRYTVAGTPLANPNSLEAVFTTAISE